MFEQIILTVILLTLSYALAPKPKFSTPPADKDIDVPTADEGQEIPVLFGTKTIRKSNVVWYGNLQTKAIKKSQ